MATAIFDEALEERANQLYRPREDVSVEATELLRTAVPGGSITDAGLRNNVAVTLRYLESWLRRTGAVGIFNLMEDAATAEIARAQIWQWCHHKVATEGGPAVDAELVRRLSEEDLDRLTADLVEAGLGD